MKSLAALLVVALFAGIAVYFVMTRAPIDGESKGKTKILTTEADFRDKVSALKRDRLKLVNGIQRLNDQKAKTLQKLKDKGITSSSDIKGDKDVMYDLTNLKEWKLGIEKLESQVSKYDDAINSIVVMLDKLERERIDKSVGLNEEQLIDLRKIVVDLDERLGVSENDPLADEELGRILDEEMKDDLLPN